MYYIYIRKKEENSYNFPFGSFSCNLFRTLISRRAASRYLLTFLITFNANCRPPLVPSLTCTTLPNVPSPNVRTISSEINKLQFFSIVSTYWKKQNMT